MRDFETGLTVKKLKSLLIYDPDTGLFFWRISPSQRTKAGFIAGGRQTLGYIRIPINGFRYFAHRLAWFYMHEAWPPDLDHINRVTSDNRIINLREIPTPAHNSANRKRFNTNTSGYSGVVRSRSGRWRARIHSNSGKSKSLGTFIRKEDAHAAYQAEKLKRFGEFAVSGLESTNPQTPPPHT